MTTPEMHVWFRQLAQQMGMQNVRALLPEQIDLLINAEIKETINRIIRENVALTNDRVISDNSKVGQINALSTLYDIQEVDFGKTKQGSSFVPDGYEFNNADYYNGKIHIDLTKLNNILYYVDFSIQYKNATVGLRSDNIPEYNTETPFNTNLYPVRLIEESKLADTLNDFILSPRFRSPVAVMYGFDSDNERSSTLDLYLGKLKGADATGYFLEGNLVPKTLRVSCIVKPNEVKFSEDANISNVNCNLPEYMHVDIVKGAVDLYRQSMSGGIQTQRNNEAANQQEALRNNYRNEGYQQ